MFIGHYGAALAAKAVAPKTSLGSLLIASVFIDLIWPNLLLLGVERVRIEPGVTVVNPLAFEYYPYSHSLLAVVGWGLLVGGVSWIIWRAPKAALIMGLLVLSHWMLDLLVHRPDLPLLPDGPFVGLGGWNSIPVTLVLEFGLLIGGAWLYLRMTRGQDKVGRWGVPALVGVLAVVYMGHTFGEPPPSVTILAVTAQMQWLLIAWAFWADRHRVATQTA